MSGRNAGIMYGSPPVPRPWRELVEELKKNVPSADPFTEERIEDVPPSNPASDELHPCLECRKLFRGEVCPFCTQAFMKNMTDSFTRFTDAFQKLSDSFVQLSAELRTLKERSKRPPRQYVPPNPDRARKKRK